MNQRFSIVVMLLILLSISTATAQTNQPRPEPTEAQTEEQVATEATDEPTKDKSIDWFEVIVAGSYILGVIVLLPLVIYTNINEKIKPLAEEPTVNLSEEERNTRAEEMLTYVEEKLTHYLNDEGQEMATIDKGSQAKMMKRTLDYINAHLAPTDPEILQMVHENELLYKQTTDRKYTGSNWVLGAAIGIVILMGIIDVSMLLSAFVLLHALGIAFYWLSSRTPQYIFNKRMERFGGSKLGIVGGVMGGIFAGASARHYVSVNGGAYHRDWESEGSMTVMTLFIVVVVAMFVAFLVAFFGILNFFLNYATNYLNPFLNEVKWAEKHFGAEDERMITMSA